MFFVSTTAFSPHPSWQKAHRMLLTSFHDALPHPAPTRHRFLPLLPTTASSPFLPQFVLPSFHVLPSLSFATSSPLLPQPLNRCPRCRLVDVEDIGRSMSRTSIWRLFFSCCLCGGEKKRAMNPHGIHRPFMNVCVYTSFFVFSPPGGNSSAVLHWVFYGMFFADLQSFTVIWRLKCCWR